MGVTRLPNGITSNDPNDPILADLPITAPQRVFMHFDDFTESPSSWVNAETSLAWPYRVEEGPGTGINDISAVATAPFGAIEFDCGSEANALTFFTAITRSFEIVAGRPVWFEALFTVLAPAVLADMEMFVGLSNSTGAPPPSDDGAYFFMDAGGDIRFECRHNGFTEISEVMGTVELGVEQKVGFYFDGSAVRWAYQGIVSGKAAIEDLPLGEIDIMAGIANVNIGTARMQLDYFMIAQRRVALS